nr:DUF3427 domain-containing protein [Methanoculleus sp.]
MKLSLTDGFARTRNYSFLFALNVLPRVGRKWGARHNGLKYKDYAVNETLFHWQSQSTTSASSPTGRRYIERERRGSKVLLFVREYNRVDGITQPYLFLGTARYLSHEGSRPMSITWELDHPMPPGFFLKANKMVAG